VLTQKLSAIVSALISLTLATAACRSESATPSRQAITVMRPAGSWQGRGNRTIGFVSESGRFRVRWETRNEDPPTTGTFRLTVHSAVSGRPIQVIADHRGAGSGNAKVEDDPRPYNLMVDSTNVDWSLSIEEEVAGYADAPKSGSVRDD
jgi:hypothetical protein